MEMILVVIDKYLFCQEFPEFEKKLVLSWAIFLRSFISWILISFDSEIIERTEGVLIFLASVVNIALGKDIKMDAVFLSIILAFKTVDPGSEAAVLIWEPISDHK